MGFYERQAVRAKRLIARRGLAMTLKVTTKGTYDPNTRLFGADTVTDHPCVGIVEDYNLKDIDGTVIKHGDKKITIAASDLTVTPLAENLLVIGTETWQVVRNKPLAPAGIPVIHTVQVRT